MIITPLPIKRLSIQEYQQKNKPRITLHYKPKRNTVKTLLKRKGLIVLDYFGGTFESAKSDERKEFQRMLSYVKRNKEVDTIIVYSYDRFSRTGPNGAYISQQLLKNGVKTLSATQEVDPLSPRVAFNKTFTICSLSLIMN